MFLSFVERYTTRTMTRNFDEKNRQIYPSCLIPVGPCFVSGIESEQLLGNIIVRQLFRQRTRRKGNNIISCDLGRFDSAKKNFLFAKIARRDCIKNIDCTQTLPAYLAREIEFDP